MSLTFSNDGESFRRVEMFEPFNIPEISEERLRELAEHIKPLVRRETKLYFIEEVDPHSVAFRWEPTIAQEATDLREVALIPTLHGYGYHGFFKPSIAEVLAQIPEDLVDKVNAFEVVGPETLHEQWDVVNAGYHLAAAILYGLVEQ